MWGKSWDIIFRFQAKAGDIFRKVTLGWTLLLPFYHTTSEVTTHESHESNDFGEFSQVLDQLGLGCLRV